MFELSLISYKIYLKFKIEILEKFLTFYLKIKGYIEALA